MTAVRKGARVQPTVATKEVRKADELGKIMADEKGDLKGLHLVDLRGWSWAKTTVEK